MANVKIYAIENSSFTGAGYERGLAMCGAARRERTVKLLSPERRAQSVAAEVILRLALSDCGYCGNVEIAVGEFGKPFFKAPQGVFFNLSHSGGWTAAALSDTPVGCDIQKKDGFRAGVAERFFSEEEKYDLSSVQGDKEELFYRYWTAKESYLKAVGTGLTRPLASFSVKFTPSGGQIVDPSDKNTEEWKIAEYAQIEGYSLACCAKGAVFEEFVKILSF